MLDSSKRMAITKDVIRKRALVAHLLEKEGIKQSDRDRITPRANPDDLPLSFAQQRLWFIEQLNGGSNAAYNISSAVRIEGDLQPHILERVLNEIVKRHEVLRSSFSLSDGTPLQSISPSLSLHMPLIDLSSLPSHLRFSHLLHLARLDASTPFDLSHPPLLRASLIRLDSHDFAALLSMHHIISDGWSTAIFMRELALLYHSFSRSLPSPLPPLPIQYADFARWQRDWLQGERLDSQLSYWRNQLSDAPSLLELPTDHPRPALRSMRGSRRSLHLSEHLSEALRSFSQREGVTLFMTMLMAFKVLLWHYTRQSDLVVGTPIAGRNRSEVEPLIGFFVNTLALRTRLRGEWTLKEAVAAVREVCVGAYAHQDLPFEKLVEELQPERSLSHTPLFQVMFTLQQAPTGGEEELGGLRLSGLEVEDETEKFDLTMMVEERGGEIEVALGYNAEIFEGESIERMLKHYEQVVTVIGTSGRQKLREIELLGREEREQILRGWNETRVEWEERDREDDREKTGLHQLIERQAERRPDAIALTYEGEHLTYKELNERANQLAHHLLSLGVSTDSQVGVLMHRSLEMVISLLGILKAGAAYVPLDPSYPQQRLSFMLADAGVSVLLTQESLHTLLPKAATAHILALDSMTQTLSQHPVSNPAINISGDNLAYMIYTSGSTGQPKGAMNSHRAIINRLLWMQHRYQLTTDDVVLQKTPFSFDVSVWEFFWPLITGARLVIARPDGHKDSSYLIEIIQREEVTTLHFVPAMLQVFVEEEAVSSCRSIRRIIASGEALSAELAQRCLERIETTELHNLYGPTEAAVDVTAWQCQRGESGRNIPIGRPIANIEIYILDEEQRAVAVGVPGELYIGGVGLARGYHHRAELTAEKFIPHPYSLIGGERLYRTGDLARYRRDGEIEYLGRIDHQVKVRGFRIELGEIESALREHQRIEDAVVVMREDVAGEKLLVGYVIVERENIVEQDESRAGIDAGGGDGERREDADVAGRVTVSELRAHLSGRLPDYMIPHAFVMLGEWPLTPSGKVDRRALPAPEVGRSQSGREYVAPRNEVERVLADVWAEVLRVKQVGVEDNYFELGGDSIRSVSLLAIAGERGVSFSLQQLFQHQTIAGLAKELELNGTDAAESRATEPFSLITAEDRARMPAGVEDAYPLTMLQAGMLFHIEYSPDSSFYHNVSSFHLRARFDAEALETAVRQLIAKHPALRTSFNLTSYSEPLQLVHRVVPVPLQVQDLRELSEEEQERLIAESIESEKSLKFDSAEPPLLRFLAQRRTDETFQFTLTEHHAILDGWSAASLLAELFNRYFGILRNDDAHMPEATVKGVFRDFVAMEREILQSEEAREYWRRKLEGSTVSMFPRWPKSEAVSDSAKLVHVEVPISHEVSEGLKRLAQTAGVPLKSALLAAYMRVLSLVSGQKDVVTGIVSHGRPEGADGERVLGLYLNTLPFRLKLRGGTWFDLARETFDAERELLPYRRYPMAQIQNEQGHALFESFFNFVNFHVYEGMERMNEVEVLGGTAFSDTNYTFSAEFSLDKDSSDITLILSGGAAELGREQMVAIRDYFAETLQSMSGAPSGRYESACLLPTDERRRLLVEWNQTGRDYPTDICLHQLFERQAARTPDALALVAGEARLTYAELNERANRLAHLLRSLGVSAESRVGVMLERTQMLLVSLLGVLKAGGAYVPLDPAYPQERVSFMLEDADVRVLLTETHLLERLPATHSAQTLAVDALGAALASQPSENPPSDASAQNLSHVIYTSGSTGIPKGVAIAHRSSATLVQWALEEFTPEQLSGVMASTSINFDLSVFEMFVPLSCGGAVLLAENALALPEVAARDEVTLINTVPSAITELVRAGRLPESLQVVNLAGEPLMRNLVQRIYEQPSVKHVVNLYGPSEDTTYSTVAWVGRDISRPVTIGRPLANTQVYLLDSWMQPVPLGATGELYIGGDGLARGYLGRPELTAEKFVPNPFSSRGGARLYRTGDVARYLPDGEIEFLGRVDHQIKLRGFRIELGEIETVLTTHPSVRQCAVLVREDTPGDKRLVAYIVGEDGGAPSVGELRSLIKQKLPEYMIPSVFVMLQEMPLTPNGKIERKRLPAPEQTREALEAEFAAPRTAVEEMLADIWSQVLGVKRVGVRDDFFELGGHSLLATQIVSRVRETFHVEIPLRKLFGAPTVGALALNVEEAMRGAAGGAEAASVPLVAVGRGGELPLSFAQQRLWFIDQVKPGSSAYNIAEAIRLKGRLSVGALGRTLNEVVRRHEVLRTTFPNVEGQARQVIAPNMTLELPVTDLREMPEALRESEAQRLAEREAQTPFDLARGPLVRARLLRLGEEDHAVLFTMHHIISDAWSMGVLVREVAALYEAFLRDEPSPLEELPLQYADFAHWQREWLRGETLDAHLAYWREQLAGAPALLELPTDRPRSPEPTFKGGRYTLSFDEHLTESLRRLNRQEGSTMFMTLLAAYQILLHHYSGKDDILVGTDVANRNRFEVEPLIGFFINQLVLRGRISEASSFSEMLAQVREVTLGAYAHQDLPFDRLVDGLKVERSSQYSPLFQVKLVFQNAPMPPLELPGLEVSSMGINSGMSRFDLQLTLWEEEAGLLRGWFEYNADLFDASTVAALADDLRSILQTVTTQPAILVGDLDRLLDEKRREREAARKEESKGALSQKYKTVRRKAISLTPADAGSSAPDNRP